jgi:hypothetical protein
MNFIVPRLLFAASKTRSVKNLALEHAAICGIKCQRRNCYGAAVIILFFETGKETSAGEQLAAIAQVAPHIRHHFR